MIKNGFGASVVQFEMPTLPSLNKTMLGLCAENSSFGSYTNNWDEWELAVIKFDDLNDSKVFDIVYDTGITEDVIGHLKEKDVIKLLEEIKKLKSGKEKC